jgi:linoleate 10R-lipoxygenase
MLCLYLLIFRTSHHDVNINETFSYAATLRQQPRDARQIMCSQRQGPDVFAEDRLLLLPPGVCALLVLFSRNHNVRYSRDFCSAIRVEMNSE